MELTGEKALPLPRQMVWDALNDPEVLRICIPGCDSITPAGEDRYDVGMVAVIGPVKAKFKGFMQVQNAVAPEGYSLHFEGTGGAAGFAKGDASVKLAMIDANQTTLHYSCTAKVGGKLAQIGSRLVDSAARMVADRFFDAFVKQLSEQLPAQEAAPDVTTVPAQTSDSLMRRLLQRLKRAVMFFRFSS